MAGGERLAPRPTAQRHGGGGGKKELLLGRCVLESSRSPGQAVLHPLRRKPMDQVSIDGISFPIRNPSSVNELGEWVREASAAGQGVYPVGGGTMLGVGLPPSKPGFAVALRPLNRVIDYPARDMTITVETGITLGELASTLARENQWLPIDVPRPEEATLGGALAVNVSGSRRLSYGTLRDYVIGIRFIADDGREVQAGGRVVKNVAGYDLMKLHIGALGTLGIVTQVTLKIRPRPEDAQFLHWRCERSALPAILELLARSRSRPVIVDVLSHEAGWVVIVGYEEKPLTTLWQVETLRKELAGLELQRCDPAGPGGVPGFGEPAVLAWKASVRPSQTGRFCLAVADQLIGWDLHAQGLSGVVYGRWRQACSEEKAREMLGVVEGLAAEAGGQVIITEAPWEWKPRLPIWGRPRGDWNLMKHIKRTLDPRNVFNPGRLFSDL